MRPWGATRPAPPRLDKTGKPAKLKAFIHHPPAGIPAERPSLMKKFALALIVCGLLVGPAYWIHAKFYTGSVATLLTLKAAAGAANRPQLWQSEPFSLAAGMAPVGLVLVAQGHFSPNMDENQPPSDHYSAILSLDGTAAKPLNFSLGVKSFANSNPAFREHLLFMNKVQPGNYTLTVTPAAEPAIQIDRMQLQVRQNLEEPDPNIVMAGIGLLIAGLLVLTLL